MNTKVLVTGATGATGSSVIEKLLELNIPVRALVHKIDERTAHLTAQGVEIVEGDLSNFNSVSAALKGVGSAYYMYPIQVDGLVEGTAYFAQAAVDEGLTHIVNMSQVAARRDAKSNASQNHWIAERLLDRTGIPVTHVRPTFFAEWLKYFAKEIKENNRIVLPFGEARYAPIAGEDSGRVIASILANPEGHAGKIYPLYGSTELTQYEIAEILSGELGRKITYVAADIDKFAELMKARYTPYFIQHVESVAQDSRDGVFSGTNDFVEKISGSKPLHIVDYIRKNIELFK
jgi:NAD(P)H dehydrogenase (quinone)